MSFVNRINRLIIDRLKARRPRTVVANGHLCVYSGETLQHRHALANLKRATLFHRDAFVGDIIVLSMEFVDGGKAEMAMGDPYWTDLIAALETADLISPGSTWQVQAIADGPNAPPRELFRN